MPKLNELQKEKIISSVSGADYSSLNSAISAIGDIKTFRIETAIVLSAAITFPAGVTLIIGSQGSISGSHTLTGNKTVIKFEGLNSCLGSDVTFAGSWLTIEILPELFGAVADGVTDDIISINKAADFARLTNTKTLLFSSSYKVGGAVSATDLTVDFKNNAKIIGTNGKTMMFAGNSSFPYPATYYNITADAVEGEDHIVCTNATMLAAIKEGDLINIISNKVFAEGNVQGEIQKVHLIDGATGAITFRNFLHDSYAMSDTARICIYPMYKFSTRGLAKLEYPEWTIGDQIEDLKSTALWLRGIENADVNVEIRNAGGAGVQLTDCYEPDIHARTFSVDVAGEGYGCVVSCSTMRARVTGNFVGSRHPIAHGGGSTGVPWESYIYNVVSVISVVNPGAGFDVHDNVGSVTFNNCTAYGRGGATQAGTGGFSLNARYNRIYNCRAYNVEMAFMSTGPSPRSVEIDNCSAVNSKYGFFTNSTSRIGYLSINGLRLQNESAIAGSYGLYLAYSYVTRWYFKNISLRNVAVGMTINELNDATIPDLLLIDGFEHINDAATGGNVFALQHKGLKQVVLRNITSINNSQLVYCNASSVNLKIFSLEGAYIEKMLLVKAIEIHPELTLVNIANAIFKDPVTAASLILYMNNGSVTIRMMAVHTEGNNMDYLTEVLAGQLFTNFQPVGCDFVGLTALHKALTPTNTIGEETSIGIV